MGDYAETVPVRDIYRLEYEIFRSGGWVLFYISSVVIFCTHMCLGWQKVVPAPALDIPKRYHAKATHVGYIMTAFIALIYFSFPIFCYMTSMKEGYFKKEGAIEELHRFGFCSRTRTA